jgi:hypothetical protein
MDKVTRYKKMYPPTNGINELVIEASGKVHMPTWLIKLLLNDSALKSRKKRIIKKVLKRQLQKLIENYAEQEANN